MNKNIFFTGAVVLIIIFASCASGAKYAPEPSAPMSYDPAGVGYSRDSARYAETERMVAYSVNLELSVKNTDETRKLLITQVSDNNGFIIRETDNYINMRIPSGNTDNFMKTARTLGKTENETKTGTDITDQYRDNVIRLENLLSVRTRYLSLLDIADSVSDILSIEKELERVNTEIDIMQGRIKYAELSVSYTNITVRFREKAKPGPIGWIFYGLYLGVKWLFVWN